jgi:1,2-diacylglycerol 3-beta-galactosyltransferase
MVTEDMLPRIAILMAHTGGGHLSAARSLAEALEDRARVTIISLVDDYVDFPWNTMSVAYGPWVNYAPWLYHLIYRAFDSRRRVEFTYRAAYPLVRREVAAAFAPDWPDIVVSVHPLQTEIPLRALRELGNPAPFITVVTDPVTPPVAWFCPDVDLTVVATEPARQTAIQCDVPAEHIRILGLPVRKAFSTIWGRPKPNARTQLGLEADRPLALLTGGGAGIGKLMPLARGIARRLAAATYPAQMAIIAGRNQLLRKQLQAEPWPVPVKVLGFVEDMPNWLTAADLLVSKAGPGTLAEATCAGLPVIITGHIPGQEDGNVTWLEQHGAGIYAREPERVGALVTDLLRPDNPLLVHMAVQSRSLAHCDASALIAQAVLEFNHQPGRSVTPIVARHPNKQRMTFKDWMEGRYDNR